MGNVISNCLTELGLMPTSEQLKQSAAVATVFLMMTAMRWTIKTYSRNEFDEEVEFRDG